MGLPGLLDSLPPKVAKHITTRNSKNLKCPQTAKVIILASLHCRRPGASTRDFIISKIVPNPPQIDSSRHKRVTRFPAMLVPLETLPAGKLFVWMSVGAYSLKRSISEYGVLACSRCGSDTSSLCHRKSNMCKFPRYE